MIITRFQILIRSISEWRAIRALLSLAKRESFERTSPESISKILSNFASTKQVNTAHGHEHNDFRLVCCRHALLRIWELSEHELKKETGLKFKWNRVMATCNALYETLSGPNPTKSWASK